MDRTTLQVIGYKAKESIRKWGTAAGTDGQEKTNI